MTVIFNHALVATGPVYTAEFKRVLGSGCQLLLISTGLPMSAVDICSTGYA